MNRNPCLSFTSKALLLLSALEFPGALFAQSAPVIESFHIINATEPALVGQLDSGDRFGRDFNPLGDLNLDGVPDFLVGARSDDDGATDAGAVYVLFMNADGSVKGFTKISDTSGGLTAAGVSLSEGQFFGYSVTTVGDLDGDSVQDIAVGARRGGAVDDGGAVFILFLNRDGTVKGAQPITNNTGNLGHTLQTSDFFGESTTALGTIDGLPTLAVANAADGDGGNRRGAIFILRLNPDGTAVADQTVKISSLSGGFGTGLEDGDQFGGRDITPLGDIDGDGNLDIAVAAFQSDEGRGAVWILRLNADFTVKAKQKIAQGSGGLQATLNVEDFFGHAVTGAGDLDGDGIPDLITSANKSDAGGTDSGELYYLFLNADGTVKTEARVGSTSGTLPFALPEGGRLGRSLALLGDLADDGTQCLVAGGGAGSTGTLNLLFTLPPSTLLLSDPRAVPGNVLWLDGSDVDGDFVAGGNFLNNSQWVDKSSERNAHASQTVTSQRPSATTNSLNGLSVVSFDGDDFMDVAPEAFGMLRNTTGATVFAVARPTSNSGARGNRVFMASTGTGSAATRAGFNFFDSFGTSIGGAGDAGLAGRRLDADPYQRINGGSVGTTAFSTWTGAFDYAGGNLQLYADGELVTESNGFQMPGNTSDTDSLNIRLGADASLDNLRGFFTGDLAELIVYDRLLLPSEQRLVEAYLNAKWSPLQLDIATSGNDVMLSWPASPVPWRLEASEDLSEFFPSDSIPERADNRQSLVEPVVKDRKFYRLTRP